MNRRAARVLILIGLLAFGLSTAAWSQGTGPDATDEEREAAEEAQRIVEQAKKEKRIIESLRSLDGRFKQYTDELDALRAEEKRLEKVIVDNRAQYERTRVEHEEATRSAASRLAALYKLYRGSGLEYLFSAAGALDFVKRYRYALYVVRGDVTSIRRFEQSLQAMNRQNEALVERQADIGALADKIASKRHQARVTRREHRNVLAEIRNSKELHEIAIGERTRSTREIQERLNRLSAGGDDAVKKLKFAELKGYLDPPVRGTIAGTFGRKVHSRFKTVTYNRGIDIAAPAGTPVRVVFDGDVRLVQDFLAYGRVVIVDHGERYHSLYAHIEDPRVKPGQTLRRGEIIGLVGQTAAQEKPLLHFEIRHQGKALDPGDWLFIEGD